MRRPTPRGAPQTFYLVAAFVPRVRLSGRQYRLVDPIRFSRSGPCIGSRKEDSRRTFLKKLEWGDWGVQDAVHSLKYVPYGRLTRTTLLNLRRKEAVQPTSSLWHAALKEVRWYQGEKPPTYSKRERREQLQFLPCEVERRWAWRILQHARCDGRRQFLR